MRSTGNAQGSLVQPDELRPANLSTGLETLRHARCLRAWEMVRPTGSGRDRGRTFVLL
jgi:hypothetical protein